MSANLFLTTTISKFLATHIYQAKKGQGWKVYDFNKTDKGESHAEPKHSAYVCDESCSCHHLE